MCSGIGRRLPNSVWQSRWHDYQRQSFYIFILPMMLARNIWTFEGKNIWQHVLRLLWLKSRHILKTIENFYTHVPQSQRLFSNFSKRGRTEGQVEVKIFSKRHMFMKQRAHENQISIYICHITLFPHYFTCFTKQNSRRGDLPKPHPLTTHYN